MKRELVEFMGLKIDCISKDQALMKVKQLVETDGYHYQISVNVAKLVYAQKDENLLKAINEADIINADGLPINLIVQKIKKKKNTRMGGYDYIEGLAKSYPRFRYYLLGAKQEVLETVEAKLKKKYNINIVGFRNGYFSLNNITQIINDINKTKPDVLFLALGTPNKEYFLHQFKNELKVKVAIGVGGAFDIIAGAKKRAPFWVQKIACEWLYRLMQEPKRMFKRYAITNALFFIMILRRMLTSKNL